jgi:hypothetical protein
MTKNNQELQDYFQSLLLLSPSDEESEEESQSSCTTSPSDEDSEDGIHRYESSKDGSAQMDLNIVDMYTDSPKTVFHFYPNPLEEKKYHGENIVALLAAEETHTSSVSHLSTLQALSLSSFCDEKTHITSASSDSIAASLKSLEFMLEELTRSVEQDGLVPSTTVLKDMDAEEHEEQPSHSHIAEEETPLFSNKRFEFSGNDEEETIISGESVNVKQLQTALAQIQAVLKYHEEHSGKAQPESIQFKEDGNLTVTSSVTSKSGYSSQDHDDMSVPTSDEDEGEDVESDNEEVSKNSLIVELSQNQENCHPDENIQACLPPNVQSGRNSEDLIIRNDKPRLLEAVLLACRCTGPCAD